MASDIVVRFKDKKAQDFFKKIIEKQKKLSKREKQYVRRLSPIVFRDVLDHFEKETGPKGKWKKWSPFYERVIKGWNWVDPQTGRIGNWRNRPDGLRRPHGGNLDGKILQDTGFLRNNFKVSDWRKVQDGILWYNDAKSEDGKPYAAIHNDGLTWKGIKYPERRFMWLSRKGLDLMGRATVDFLMEDVK